MADDPGRNYADIELAHKLASSFVESRGQMAAIGPRPLSERFDELVAMVGDGFGRGAPFLDEPQYKQLAESYRGVLRVFAFSRAVDRPFVLALAGMTNAYDAPVVIDVFSPEALGGVGYRGAAPPADAERRLEWVKFQSLIDTLSEDFAQVTRVDLAKAARGVVTLVVDTLRVLMRGGGGPPTFGVASGSTTTTNFKVTSKNNGYRLHVFRQWRYRPRVFGGAALSSPVTDALATGHWCFEGDAGGPRIRDSGVHFCDPAHTMTTTTAF